MKGKLIFYLCVAILPYIVSIYAAGGSADKTPIDELAQQGKLINNIFRPSKNGLLGTGVYSFTYKGELIYKRKSKEVAMKFAPRLVKRYILQEYEIYTYLGSVHDPNIESYGIPRVYYFGEWEQFIIMAITLLDSEFKKRVKPGLSLGKLNDVDLLIALREFVRITKYIHSKNIYHKELHTEHLLFRRDRAFIIDYELAHPMRKKDKSGTKVSLMSNENAERRQLARKDWKAFLVSMCEIVGAVKTSDFTAVPENKLEEYIKQLEIDLPEILKKVLQNKAELRTVLIEFATFVLEDKIESTNSTDKELIYDYFDRIICEGIANLNPPEPVLVSWLTPDERTAAINDLQNNRTVPIPISSIPNPFALVKVVFPKVDHFYFTKNTVRPSANTAESSGSSRRNY